MWKSNSGAPRHRRDVVPVTASGNLTHWLISTQVGPKAAQRRFPQLQDKGLLFATVFHEAMHDDARTNVAIALTAAERGAAVANYCEVTSLVKDAQGRAEGVSVLDRVTNERFDVRAKAVVFCGGPWCDIQNFTARSHHRRGACSMAWRCRSCTRHTG